MIKKPLKKKETVVEKPKRVRVKKVEAVVEAEVATPAFASPTEFTAPAPELPIYDGHKVLWVLKDGHTDTHYHCKMSNGTTMHVPKTLFI